MKQTVQVVLRARVNIDVLPNVNGDSIVGIGVRLRPYGKQAAKDVMILGYGPTFEQALEDCHAKAIANRWESLSWSARPWASDPTETADDPFAGPTNPF